MYISIALGLIANAKQRQRLVEYRLKVLKCIKSMHYLKEIDRPILNKLYYNINNKLNGTMGN